MAIQSLQQQGGQQQRMLKSWVTFHGSKGEGVLYRAAAAVAVTGTIAQREQQQVVNMGLTPASIAWKLPVPLAAGGLMGSCSSSSSSYSSTIED
jgi:hypothetical protein